jgi:hypothetical protein
MTIGRHRQWFCWAERVEGRKAGVAGAAVSSSTKMQDTGSATIDISGQP